MANKLWNWLFGRKKKEAAEGEGTNEAAYDRSQINVHDGEERTRYLEDCLEQMGEAQKELNLLTGEYSMITAYLTDMEEIEALPGEQMEQVKASANKLVVLERERQRFLGKEKRLSESDYQHMLTIAEEAEEGIGKLKKEEKLRKLIKQDLAKLDGERHACAYRKNELKSILINLKGMAVICLAALIMLVVILLALQFLFSMDTVIGYFISIAAAAIAITVFFIKYTDAEKELGRVERTANKLILLQNKVKIRYVNNANLLDYLYVKYDVKSASELEEKWTLYQEDKEERRQFAEAEAQAEFYKKELTSQLLRYRVKEPDRWACNPAALLDAREMVEIRHGLILQRQALRKQMEYNQELAESASEEIKQLAADYPQYAAEISALVDRFEREYG